SVSFALLSSVFGFIVFFNMLDGKVRSKGGYALLGLGVLFIVVGIVVTPLLYLGIAYLAIMFALAALGGRLWDAKVGKWLLIGAAGAFALSLLDPNFFLIAAKPDNVPIGAMIFLLGIFTWIALSKAYLNDKQIAGGGIPWEKTESDEKLFTWPDLVYTEMLCMILLTIVMIVWSVALRAPLEEAANPTSSPNPAKAPWYFLGLQEMLVYFDPWLAGVVLPTLIIVGLMAVPYIDTNPKGNGYYSFRERKWELGIFLYGFLVLWSFLIITGTFLRGPNWNFFGPYEYWDPNKLVPLVNIDLSELIWVKALGMPLPHMWLIRELFGIIIVVLYLSLPPLLAAGPFRRFYLKMGGPRFYVGAFLFLSMMSLPIKMVLRWLFNLKYIVHIQEIFFNI
ncbi:MAG: cytochrome, partial [Acidobacteria bacterium]|nr:cytochrome [Acidobacteriota bacterium]